jgi:hypothetical protein
MADSYYYQIDGQTQGPLTPAALKQLANEGAINESTLVRRGEQGAWYQAGTLAGLIPPKAAPEAASPGFETSTADLARQTFRKAEEHAEKVAEKLWFLDLKFSQFFTPKLIGALWALYLCLAVILFVVGTLSDLFNAGLFPALLHMVVHIVALAFSLVFGRVMLEVILVTFRIAESLEPLKHLENLKHLATPQK